MNCKAIHRSSQMCLRRIDNEAPPEGYYPSGLPFLDANKNITAAGKLPLEEAGMHMKSDYVQKILACCQKMESVMIHNLPMWIYNRYLSRQRVYGTRDYHYIMSRL